MRTNVDGTRNVFEAVAAAAVKRAVVISSTTVYPLSFRALDEDAPLRPLSRATFASAYGVSKAEAERIAVRLCNEHDIGLTTFRPCGITGPHDPLLIAAIERVMSLPVTLYPAFSTIGVVHAADVAAAVLLALEKPVATGKVYNLQGNDATLWQIADAWRHAGGRAPLLRIPVPVPFALRYDDTRARRELSWSPRSLDAILEEAVRLRQ